MTTRINPLPIIADWLDSFPYHDCSDMSREDLVQWLNRNSLRNGNYSRRLVYNLEDDHAVELAVDCLIAAGIGREAEQGQTVYCQASGFATELGR